MKRPKTKVALKLRREPTEAENKFWNCVRNRQIDSAKFRRQWPIGDFVADFACLEAKLVVEIDGGQHAESHTDAARTIALEAAGYRVIRFWNNDVLGNIDGVLTTIQAELAKGK